MFEIMNKKIDLLMATNNISLKELADKLELTTDELKSRLSCKTEWQTIEAIKIAECFNTTIEELVNNNYRILKLKK